MHGLNKSSCMNTVSVLYPALMVHQCAILLHIYINNYFTEGDKYYEEFVKQIEQSTQAAWTAEDMMKAIPMKK